MIVLKKIEITFFVFKVYVRDRSDWEGVFGGVLFPFILVLQTTATDATEWQHLGLVGFYMPHKCVRRLSETVCYCVSFLFK